jgi:hypothetical protein
VVVSNCDEETEAPLLFTYWRVVRLIISSCLAAILTNRKYQQKKGRSKEFSKPLNEVAVGPWHMYDIPQKESFLRYKESRLWVAWHGIPMRPLAESHEVAPPSLPPQLHNRT